MYGPGKGEAGSFSTSAPLSLTPPTMTAPSPLTCAGAVSISTRSPRVLTPDCTRLLRTLLSFPFPSGGQATVLGPVPRPSFLLRPPPHAVSFLSRTGECALVDQKETHGLCILSAHLTAAPVASCSIVVVPLALCVQGCGDWVVNEWKPRQFLGPTSPAPEPPAFSQAPADKSAIPPNVQAMAECRPSPKGDGRAQTLPQRRRQSADPPPKATADRRPSPKGAFAAKWRLG